MVLASNKKTNNPRQNGTISILSEVGLQVTTNWISQSPATALVNLYAMCLIPYQSRSSSLRGKSSPPLCHHNSRSFLTSDRQPLLLSQVAVLHRILLPLSCSQPGRFHLVIWSPNLPPTLQATITCVRRLTAAHPTKIKYKLLCIFLFPFIQCFLPCSFYHPVLLSISVFPWTFCSIIYCVVYYMCLYIHTFVSVSFAFPLPCHPPSCLRHPYKI